MKTVVALFAVFAMGASMAAAQTSNSNCTVVELKKGDAAPSGSTSVSTITAGGGKVTGTTTGPGGTVTHSSNSGGLAISSASDGNSTVVTDSTGKCIIYRKAEGSK